MGPERYNRRQTLQLLNSHDNTTIEATVIDRRSFSIGAYILPELVCRVSMQEAPLQLRVFDRAMITNRQRFNRWTGSVEREYTELFRSGAAEKILNDTQLLTQIESAITQMHNHPIDTGYADWPACAYSPAQREAYYHATVRDAFASMRDYYMRLSQVLGDNAPRVYGYYTVQLADTAESVLLPQCILMEDLNGVYTRSSDHLLNKLPQEVHMQVAETMLSILEKLDSAAHVNVHLSLQSFKFRHAQQQDKQDIDKEGTTPAQIILDDPKFGCFRTTHSDEEWRRTKSLADEHNQLCLLLYTHFKERGEEFKFEPLNKYRDSLFASINTTPTLYAHHLNELGPDFSRYRRDRGYTLECPYAVGDTLTLAVDGTYNDYAAEGLIDVEILHLFQPVTVSPVMKVKCVSGDNSDAPLICILKLFDRRCAPTARYVCKDSGGTEDWSGEVEREYVEWVDSGASKEFDSAAYSERQVSNTGARSLAQDEEVLRRHMNAFYATELAAYEALSVPGVVQEGDVPMLYASVKHPTRVNGGHTPQSHFNAPGLLMEYIDGVKLDAMFDSVPRSQWEKLTHASTHLVHRLLDRGIMNTDARPDQVIVRRVDNELKPTLIDFGECVLRHTLASDAEFLSHNRYDIENNINKLMHERFRERGVDFNFALTHKYSKNGAVGGSCCSHV